MYHVSAQGVDERMINVHYYYVKIRTVKENCSSWLDQSERLVGRKWERALAVHIPWQGMALTMQILWLDISQILGYYFPSVSIFLNPCLSSLFLVFVGLTGTKKLTHLSLHTPTPRRVYAHAHTHTHT